MAVRKISRFRRYLDRDLKIYRLWQLGHYTEEIALAVGESRANVSRIIREMRVWMKLYGSEVESLGK